MASFVRTLRAEWTKFRTVRGTAWCLLLAIGLMVGLSTLLAAAGKTDDGPHRTDEFSFVHQTMSGDGSITARVKAQDDSHQWAKAGILIKDGIRSGSAYAAAMLTPAHGVRMEADFTSDFEGSDSAAPSWLRLTRSGRTVEGYESADGTTWNRIGSVDLPALPAAAEVGLFVTSPFRTRLAQGGGADGVELTRTNGRAVFDHVTVQPDRSGANWHRDDVTTAADRFGNPLTADYGTMSEATGAFTLTGTGDIAGYGIPSYNPPDARDTVADSLQGVQIGLMALVALGALFAATEYRTGLVRTTFAATPRRGQVLAAKTMIVGGTTFVTGLLASTTSFLIAQAVLRGRGLRPPAYPYRSLTEGPVLRAVIGTALVLAVLAVLALAVATILRRSAVTIALVVGLVLVPQILGAAAIVSLDGELWLNRLTPAAGLAIQQARVGFHTAIGPWAGLGVLCAYAAAGLGTAHWRLRNGDA